MRVSIIIPSFGQVQYLKEAINSALNQSYPCEVIVVDDGSTDGSLELARMYPVKVISQINKGLASARNAGIMNATGDYLFFLDADDILLLHGIETLLHKALESEADVTAPSLRCFTETDKRDTVLIPNPTFEDFKEGNRLPYCCLYKKEVLLETGGYSPRMDTLGGWEDLSLHYDMMHRGKKIVTIQEPLVLYRVKEKSMVTEAKKNSKALWEQLVKDFPEVKDHVKD